MSREASFFSRGTWFLLIISLGFIIFGLKEYREIDNYNQTIAASRNWPVTEGEVTEAKIIQVVDEYLASDYISQFTYQYEVSGSKYRCGFSMNVTSNKQYAEEDLRALPVGSRIKVAYNPEAPQTCVSEYDKGEAPILTVFLFLGALIFVIVFIIVERKSTATI